MTKNAKAAPAGTGTASRNASVAQHFTAPHEIPLRALAENAGDLAQPEAAPTACDQIDTFGCAAGKGENAEEPDNAAFMAAIFHALPDGASATVTSFEGNPARYRERVGQLRPGREIETPATANNYFCVSSHYPGDDGVVRRKKVSFAALHCIMLRRHRDQDPRRPREHGAELVYRNQPRQLPSRLHPRRADPRNGCGRSPDECHHRGRSLRSWREWANGPTGAAAGGDQRQVRRAVPVSPGGVAPRSSLLGGSDCRRSANRACPGRPAETPETKRSPVQRRPNPRTITTTCIWPPHRKTLSLGN
jgi:hypothetical protein